MPEKKKQPNTTQSKFRRALATPIRVSKERDYVLENLSVLVEAGTPVATALNALEIEMRSKFMKRALRAMVEQIENGTPLWKAFVNSRIFNEHTISLVRIGEESGRLAENLRLVALQEKKERLFRSKVRSAMVYPVFVFGLSLAVGLLVSWFILPQLASVFAQLDIDLPTITRILISAGIFLEAHGHIVLPALLVFIGLLVYFLFFFSKTRFIGQAMLFTLPGVRRLVQHIELARFGYIVGTLLEAGVPIDRALESLEEATVFVQYKKMYAYLRQSIIDGSSFQKSFAEYKPMRRLIPTPMQQLVVAAEQSGNLSSTFLSINKSVESRLDEITKNITVMLEPVLLVIVWVGVVGVALAVILPIYSLVGGVYQDDPAVDTAPEVEVLLDIPPEEAEYAVEGVREIVSGEDEDVGAIFVTSDEEENTGRLRILETGIGYLRVRDEPDTEEGVEISRVYKDEEYDFTDQGDGWYEIMLVTGQAGWVFGEYVELIETQ